MARKRSIPLWAARCLATTVLVVALGTWGVSYRWILERHWVDLTTFQTPMGWVIVMDGDVYWGAKHDGYALAGFGRHATVQWHAWKRQTPLNVPTPLGKFSLVAPTFAIGFPAVLLWTMPAMMVWNRRRRGLCTCGYDLKGLPRGSPCPECGQFIASVCVRPERA